MTILNHKKNQESIKIRKIDSQTGREIIPVNNKKTAFIAGIFTLVLACAAFFAAGESPVNAQTYDTTTGQPIPSGPTLREITSAIVLGSSTIANSREYVVDESNIQAKSVLVKNLSNDTILYSKDADAKLPLASLTKLMTAITVKEIQNNWNTYPKSVKLISNGETLTKADRAVAAGGYMEINDLLSYMLLSSSNFAAHSLSHELIPYTSFVAFMNHTALQIGLTNSSFIDSVGLTQNSNVPALRNSSGSANDITTLLKLIVGRYPELANATHLQTAYVTDVNGEQIEVENTNILLSEIPDIVLGKTGFTNDAGGNLAVVIKRGEQYYSIVVLGSTIEGRFADVKYLASQI